MSEGENWNGHMDLWFNNGVRPPMVPTYEDLILMRTASSGIVNGGGGPRVLVLGVTPAIIMAHWLNECEIVAVDYDQGMIQALWPMGLEGRSEAICADWAKLPFPDDHFDLVVGDGSFCALPSVDHYSAVIAEIQRVKRAEAPIVVRFFVRPTERIRFKDLVGEIGNACSHDYEPSEFNFLTMMAACEDDGSVQYNKVADKIRQDWGDPDAYIAAGWPDENEARRFRSIIEIRQQLNFPKYQQITEKFSRFNLSAKVFQPSYRVGAFCPTLRFD